jgi:hypothetical protein
VSTEEWRFEISASRVSARGRTRRQIGGHVLHRMYRDVRTPLLDRDFQFLDEQAFAADLRKASVLDAVPLGGHRYELHLQSRVRLAQKGCDMLRLPEREFAFSSGYPE